MPTNQNNLVDHGELQIRVNSSIGALPVENATIEISYTGDPNSTIESVKTDRNGVTDTITLDTPPLEYSMSPSENQPYAEYTFRVSAPDFETITITGAELMSGVKALQDVSIAPTLAQSNPIDVLTIGPHTLFGDYPPKIAESEIKPLDESGEIVLSRVVIPEYIIVHDGSINDSTASNYYVKYKDYIKNVASCEIYATWPRSTIEANVLAIMSFTLNRVYTEWYRNKGYDFTITSSTAYDHKWIKGKNSFDTINEVVDQIFANYLSRPNVTQPILTQYCDGKRVTCNGWMTQWGSKYLGDQGYAPIEILRYYYGNDMYINTAEQISGIPASWPGSNLTIGSSGEKVRQMQTQLNRIAEAYPSMPTIAVDGRYGEATAASVRQFQSIFGLPTTGVVDYPTWYKISEIYVAVSRIAELR
ncbi:MAG: peptidoglycan-binding protein [Lachnospiraceae bacterium]|nr:peptidoglycan-binding protein [Lachnospiraceae bacterium]